MKNKVETAYVRWGEIKTQYQKEYKSFKTRKTLEGKKQVALIRAELRMAKLEYQFALKEWKTYTSAWGQLALS